MSNYFPTFKGTLGVIGRINPFQIVRFGWKRWKRRRGKEIQWARRRRLARGIAHT